jgi:DNA invertase Pin-like site-specific DNA recombinase
MRAIVYGAKSTVDVKGSIATQLADGRALAEAQGLDVVADYQDEAKSAFSGDRGPGLAAALAHCEALAAEHGSSVLVVQHSDRLARGDGRQAKHLVEYVLWALKHGVTIKSVQDPGMFPEGDLGILLGALGGMRNTEDSARKKASVRDGLVRRTHNEKRKLGGPCPYGYQRVDSGERTKDGRIIYRLEPKPGEREVVVRIFEMAASGMSQRAIALRLDADQVPRPGGTRWWGQPTVGRILGNVVYKGMISHGIYEPVTGRDLHTASATVRRQGRRVGEEVLPGEHEEIVSEALWQDANDNRRASSRPSAKGGGTPKGRHLLTHGVLRCGRCGSAMLPRTDQEGRQTYVCGGRRLKGRAYCSQSAVTRDVVDEAILTELQTRYLDIDETRRRVQARHAADTTIAAEALAQAHRELARAEAALAKVQRGWREGVLDDDDYRQQRVEVMEERDAAAAALKRAQEHVKRIEDADGLQDAEEALLRRLASLRDQIVGGIDKAPDLPALRSIVGQLFSAIELCPPESPFGAQDLPGQLEGSTPSVGQYRLLLRVRPAAFDLEAFEAVKVPLSASEFGPRAQMSNTATYGELSAEHTSDHDSLESEYAWTPSQRR